MKNPIINAVLASAYIVLIVLLIQGFMLLGKAGDGKDNILMPMVMLSLLTLSAAVMAYLFGATPVRMYLDGAKGEAINFFLKTIVAFAVITAAFILALFAYSSFTGV
jgi:hypothetical protein